MTRGEAITKAQLATAGHWSKGLNSRRRWSIVSSWNICYLLISFRLKKKNFKQHNLLSDEILHQRTEYLTRAEVFWGMHSFPLYSSYSPEVALEEYLKCLGLCDVQYENLWQNPFLTYLNDKLRSKDIVIRTQFLWFLSLNSFFARFSFISQATRAVPLGPFCHLIISMWLPRGQERTWQNELSVALTLYIAPWNSIHQHLTPVNQCVVGQEWLSFWPFFKTYFSTLCGL